MCDAPEAEGLAIEALLLGKVDVSDEPEVTHIVANTLKHIPKVSAGLSGLVDLA